MESITLEMEELKKEILGYEEQLKTVSQSVDNYEKQLQDVEENTKETKVVSSTFLVLLNIKIIIL